MEDDEIVDENMLGAMASNEDYTDATDIQQDYDFSGGTDYFSDDHYNNQWTQNNNNNNTIIKRASNSNNNNNNTIDKGDALIQGYQRIEEYRNEADFFYRFLNAKQMTFKNEHLDPLVKIINNVYGVHIIPGGIDDMDKDTLKSILASSDTILKDALWFMGINTVPQIYNWLMNGDPSSGKQPPHLANRKRFEYFVRATLSQACNDLLDGRMELDVFVRKMRLSYMITCGVPMPQGLELHYGYTPEEAAESAKIHSG